jgi:hypothetical protein
MTCLKMKKKNHNLAIVVVASLVKRIKEARTTISMTIMLSLMLLFPGRNDYISLVQLIT